MISRRPPKVFFSSYRPPQAQEKPSGQFRQMAIVILVIVGGYFLTRLPVFQIRNIVLLGGEGRGISEKLETLKGESLLSGATSQKIAEILEGDFGVLNLQCDKGIPNTLRCQATLREPLLVWVTGQSRYLVDKQGYAYAEATGKLTQKSVEDRKHLPVAIGQQVISEEIVQILQRIEQNLTNEKIKVDGYFVNTSPLHPGVVSSGRSDGLPFPKQKIDILFSASYPVDIQSRLLSQVLEENAVKIKSYVDLRTAGYIYYK
jgi:hypothetical protein